MPTKTDPLSGYDTAASETGLSFRQRQEMGLTIPAMAKLARKMKKAGKLSSELDIAAAQILDALVKENPKAFGKPGINWESILAFIEKMLPIILQFLAIFGV